MQPTWYNLPDFLIEQFPELRSEIEEEYLQYLTVCENPYPHFFIQAFLAPIILGQGEPASAGDRARAGVILERILTSSDTDLAEAGLTSFLEYLADDDALREAAWQFLGTTAREWVSQLREAP